MNFVCALRDVIIAILRLIMLQLVLFVTGLHHILFNRMEVSNIQLMAVPQRRDRDRLAFVDDLKANEKCINLWQDQLIHMCQIAMTAVLYLL